MNSSDIIVPQPYGWSVATKMIETKSAIGHEGAPTASIIDELAARHEAREQIPKTEVSAQPPSFIRENPNYIAPPQVDSGVGAGLFKSKGTRGKMEDLLYSQYMTKPKAKRVYKRKAT
jgi:hypothetical protein